MSDEGRTDYYAALAEYLDSHRAQLERDAAEAKHVHLLDRTYRAPWDPARGALLQIERIGVHALRFELSCSNRHLQSSKVESWTASGWTPVHTIYDVVLELPQGPWWDPSDTVSQQEMLARVSPTIERLRGVALSVLRARVWPRHAR